MFLLLQDKDGNAVHGTDGKPLIHTDGTGFISHDLALNAQKIYSKELASELPILRFVVNSLISLCNMLSKFYLKKDKYHFL